MDKILNRTFVIAWLIPFFYLCYNVPAFGTMWVLLSGLMVIKEPN